MEESLCLAAQIVADDLKAKAKPSSGDCTVTDVLAMIFNRKKIFYHSKILKFEGVFCISYLFIGTGGEKAFVPDL